MAERAAGCRTVLVFVSSTFRDMHAERDRRPQPVGDPSARSLGPFVCCRVTPPRVALSQSGEHSLARIRRILGHSRLDTTAIYLHVTEAELRGALQAHPLAEGSAR